MVASLWQEHVTLLQFPYTTSSGPAASIWASPTRSWEESRASAEEGRASLSATQAIGGWLSNSVSDHSLSMGAMGYLHHQYPAIGFFFLDSWNRICKQQHTCNFLSERIHVFL